MAVFRRHSRLLLICLTSVGWAFTFGVGAPLTSLWLDRAGMTDSVIGWNHAAYYFGMALAALAVPGLMRCWGPRCVVLGMVISAVTVSVFPWGGSLTGWFLLRLANGMAGALSLIPLETYINRDALPEHRGRNFGWYALSITVGYSLGNAAGVAAFPMLQGATFALGGAGALASGLSVWLGMGGVKETAASEAVAAKLSWRRGFLSYASAWSQGFLEGGMIAFMALYLIWLGYAEIDVSWITACTMLGILAFQVPVAWLADCLGRRNVLLGCYVVTLLALLLLPLCGSSPWLPLLLFAVGACSGAFYPLGLALLGESIPAQALAKANAWYLSIECLGCLCGPVVMGYAMEWGGKPALFTVSLAVLGGVLFVWAGLNLSNRGRPNSASDLFAENGAARAA